MGLLLILGMFAGILLSPLWLVLQVRTLARWRGGWRVLAALPAAAVGVRLLIIARGVARDPTSHNLWPFELGLTLAPALAFLGILISVHRRSVDSALPREPRG